MTRNYWLLKTEPTTFSIDDLAAAPDRTTCWEGVRNYQARNYLRDEIQEGDQVLFYHSACAQPACVGTATVVRAGYPDHHAWDRNSDYFDPKSSPDNPIWYMIDIRLGQRFAREVTLPVLRDQPQLAAMQLLSQRQSAERPAGDEERVRRGGEAWQSLAGQRQLELAARRSPRFTRLRPWLTPNRLMLTARSSAPPTRDTSASASAFQNPFHR